MRGLGGVLVGLGVLRLLAASTLIGLGWRSHWNLHPGLFLNGFGGGASVAVVGLLMWSVR